VSNTASRRLLIVDDEEGMRHMLSLMLERHGFTVSTAADGAAALERLGAGDIDIVLSDVRMPGMDGLTLLDKLREVKSPVIVIMMSAFVDLDTAIEALKRGAADYVSKPFKPDEVLLKIRMADERQRLAEEHERLEAENARLRGEPSASGLVPGIIGKSKRLTAIFQTVRKIADYKSTVLLLGESGTGKELVARAIHDTSVRAKGPFVAVNCGAIPETLLESELFGHAKGAFTDATRNKRGIIEEANGGTLFLDEIGELPLQLQVKLLRFLQEDEIRRVGENKGMTVDVRVVAATARDLQQMVAEGEFREDLFYRLNVLLLTIPPLRERKDDIPLLVDHFLVRYGERLGRKDMSVSREALKVLMDYNWPGNVRELENTIERAMVLNEGDRIEVEGLPERLTREPEATPQALAFGDDLSIKRAVRTIERELIKRALEKTSGNRTRAAELLEISHRALLYKLKEYDLS
jgi:two-component system response regulator AtoC